MADTARTQAELQVLLADNSVAAISPQDLRDFLVSAVPSARAASKTVAASNAPLVTRVQADYVCDGTADQVQIQAAMDALVTSGGTVVLSEGAFSISAPMSCVSKVAVRGAGQNATVLTQTDSGESMFTGTDISYVSIEDVRLIGAGQSGATGSGISFVRSVAAATFYVTVKNVFLQYFGADGIYIDTPIVSYFERVVSFNNGFHGVHLEGTGGASGTSVVFSACFMGGNWKAGYRLKTMAYSTFNGCAADSNAVAYELDTCTGVTMNACGIEEPIDQSSRGGGYATYTGLGYRLINVKGVLNSCYGIGNIGTMMTIDVNCRLTVNGQYEGSVGTGNDFAIVVDAGATVILNDPIYTSPLSLAVGTTWVHPIKVLEVTGTKTIDGTYPPIITVDTAGGAGALTLPANAASAGRSYLIRRDGGSSVSIARAGSDTYDDAATSKTLGSDGAAIGILSVGDGEWKIVSTQGTVT